MVQFSKKLDDGFSALSDPTRRGILERLGRGDASITDLANTFATTPVERQIHIERVFNAPRDRVWKAMTDPALLAQWWGRGNKLVIEKFEPHRGGHWRVVEHADGQVHGFEGRFREVTAPERIVQT